MKSKNEVMSRFDRDVCICDTTIRDSENASGVVLSMTEKYKLAKLIDKTCVSQIDVGMPSIGIEEKKTVKRIARMGLEASVMASNRAEISDINDSLSCDVDSVSIALPVSEILYENRYGENSEWVLDKIFESVEYANSHGLYTSCVLEDAGRASLSFLVNCAMNAKQANADRIVYCDSIGVGEPFDTFERVKVLKQATDMDIEIQARNDFGMATANSLAGIKAGAKFVGASIMGIGARAGNAPLEEVALIAEEKLGIDTKIDLPALRNVATALSKSSGRRIWESKPIFGSGCFAQETGITADGNSTTGGIMEAYDPFLVGGHREIVLGKHSNVESVIAVLKQQGQEIDPDQAEKLTEMVKRNASDLHRCLSTDDLLELFQDLVDDQLFDEEPEEEDEDIVQIGDSDDSE